MWFLFKDLGFKSDFLRRAKFFEYNFPQTTKYSEIFFSVLKPIFDTPTRRFFLLKKMFKELRKKLCKVKGQALLK